MNRSDRLKRASGRVPDGETAPVGAIAVRQRPEEGMRSRAASPHLLDLKFGSSGSGGQKGASAENEKAAPRWKWRQKLDERIHLHDLRMRTLSIRPRGWRDFPPPSAKTVPHAFGITLVKFFREHPLAELTVLAVIHLLALIIWKALRLPINLFAKKPRTREPAAEAARPLPAIPMLLAVPVQPTRRESPPANRLRLAFQRPPGWRGNLLAFAVLSAVFVLPISAYGSLGALRQDKQAVMDRGLQGVNSLLAAGDAVQNREFEKAGDAFNQAFHNFTNAQAEMGSLISLAASAAAALPIKNRLSSAGPLLLAGREIAIGGADLSQGLAALDCALDPAAKISSLREHLATSLPHFERAASALAAVSPEALPDQYRERFVSAQEQLPEMIGGARRALAAADLLLAVMGTDGPKRYLVIFQNNAELRPTGGFIGSFALVDINRGQIKKVEIPGGGSYDLKGGLRVRLASPRPLHLINPNWEFQDANWFADFPTSAKKTTWFYEKSGGPTTDGVIAVNATFMEKILELTGPVDMPEYGKTIDAQNFYFETQKAVEIEYDRVQNQPKKFIADLAPKVLERILQADQRTLMQLLGYLDNALTKKDLLFWFRNGEIQSQATSLGWTGEVKNTDGDYLYVVHTNIAGQKTDLVMRDDVDHSVKVLPDGTGIVTLTVKRTHTGVKNALFSGVRNVDFMRVYVPYGSTLIEANGFDAPDPNYSR